MPKAFLIIAVALTLFGVAAIAMAGHSPAPLAQGFRGLQR